MAIAIIPASADESKNLGSSQGTRVDLTEYKAAVNQMLAASNNTIPTGWFKVNVKDSGVSVRQLRRRMKNAAEELGKHIGVHKQSNDEVVWFRVRNAPAKRAPKADKNGPVTNVTPPRAPAAPATPRRNAAKAAK